MRALSHWFILLAALGAQCGDGPRPGPAPDPVPILESWYVFPVSCSNCPGLVNVAIDRTAAPFRAKLGVGEKTSLRAVSVDGCGTEQLTLQIDRWIPSDPTVLEVEPSSSESAIVAGLAPGLSRLAAERVLPRGGRSLVGLRDPFQGTSGCAALPELVVEIVP